MKRRDFLASVSGLSLSALVNSKTALAAKVLEQSANPDGRIDKYAIYPPMGISRVGNSEQWFHAPEVPGLAPNPPGGFKDGLNQIKKQVQRFRIYGFDRRGRVVREVGSDEAKIEWEVRVANTKAAWYGFNNPLDLGPTAPGLPGKRRNSAIKDQSEREQLLVIDPGPTRIASGDMRTVDMVGEFWRQTRVKLGSLRVESGGRLLVFPGDGKSSTPLANNPINNFSDNDGWQDDWCDGYVKAKLTLNDGKEVAAENAWITCCGPNFAPEIEPFITLYDVINDVMIEAGWERPPRGPLSFRQDIYPYFKRLGLMEWVAQSANLRQGWIDVGDFLNENYIRSLADSSSRPEVVKRRKHVFDQFRNPRSGTVDEYRLPYMLGGGINYNTSPASWFLMPDTQYRILREWSEGNFVNDWDDASTDSIESLDEVPLAQQPYALTRAALDPCSGGAFHPGVEMTWPLRHKELFDGNYRIALGDRPSLLQDVGPLLTPELAFAGGEDRAPIGKQMPGDLTRWMGIPWQCDAFSCQYVEFADDFPTAVWWPALLPIDVLPEAYYNQVMCKELSADERRKFADTRARWSRGVAGVGYHAEASYTDGISNMIALWGRMGFVVRKPGPGDVVGIPDELFVEVGRGDVAVYSDDPPNMGRKCDIDRA